MEASACTHPPPKILMRSIAYENNAKCTGLSGVVYFGYGRTILCRHIISMIVNMPCMYTVNRKLHTANFYLTQYKVSKARIAKTFTHSQLNA